MSLFRQALLGFFHLLRIKELDLVLPFRRAVNAAEKADDKAARRSAP